MHSQMRTQRSGPLPPGPSAFPGATALSLQDARTLSALRQQNGRRYERRGYQCWDPASYKRQAICIPQAPAHVPAQATPL